MKQLSKKMITGTIAASVLLGGGLLATLHNSAYADPSAATGSPASQTKSGQAAPKDGMGKQGDNPQGPGNRKGGPVGQGGKGDFGQGRPGSQFDGGNTMAETGSLLEMDRQTLMGELQQKKTIAQVAQEKKGWSEDVLLQKLTEVENKALSDAVSAGKLTQQQADQIKTGLADRLKQQVEGKPPADDHGPGRGHDGDFGGLGPMGKPESLAPIIGVTQEELKAALDSGKSLAELAQEKGIDKDKLIGKLKDGMTDQITKFVDQKRTAPTKSK